MRILMVSEWAPCTYGGVSSQVRLLSEWLGKRGYDVWVMYKQGYCRGDRYIKVNSVLPLEYHVVPPILWEVKNIICDVKPDLVHVHHSFTPLSVLAVRACSKLGIPCILTNHSLPPAGESDSWTRFSYLTPYRWLLKPTIVTAVSTPAALFIRDFLGLKDTIKVIPNAIDTNKFKPNIKHREDYILYVGRLVRRKGVHILIKATKILRDMGFTNRVLIAGRGYFEHYLKLLASEIDNILFLGEVSEYRKTKLYAGAKIFVLPSIVGESFGVVLLEALSSGTPVVATNVGGVPEVVKNGSEGFLVDPGEPHKLAEAIAEILSSEELWLKMSINARKKAVEKFSIETVGRLYEQIYTEALSINLVTKSLPRRLCDSSNYT